MTQDFENWPIKLDFRTDRLEGELQPKGVHVTLYVTTDGCEIFAKLLERFSHVQKLYRVLAYMLKWNRLRCPTIEGTIPGSITTQDLTSAKEIWVKFVQNECAEELQKSVGQHVGQKVHGKFRRLSPFLDNRGIWCVGLRLREYAPFTADKRPPAFLPYGHRFTLLVMEKAHQDKHSGIEETVARFRMNGFWTPKAAKLAKSVKLKCVICRYLDKHPICQTMGGIPRDQVISPVAWGDVEMDLFGPFVCRSDVNKRSSIKVWGIVVIDRNSGAVHCDVLLDYSAQEVIKALRRFSSLRGWPVRITSDPGSQLSSSSGKLESWFEGMKGQLADLASSMKFTWQISPANSPWRQGRCESRIKSLKRLILIAAGSTRLSPIELQTVLFEVANLSNERPIGLMKTPREDGTFKVITPNTLLMGRSKNSVPDDANLGDHMKKSDRYELIQQVTSDFWVRWAQEVTPQHVIRQKWHELGRNLQIGDIVLLHDKSPLKGHYTLGIVESVNLGRDRLVRSCEVGYTVSNKRDSIGEYTGGKRITVTRSVQRLTLLLPIEDQQNSLDVEDNVVKAQKSVKK